MDNIKSLMIEKYSQIMGYEPIVDGYEPRIKRMLSTICKGRYSKEQIVDSNDTSIFSNGASGIVFTTEALCVKDAGNSTSQFIARFKDIKYCSMNEDSIFGVDISAIKLHMRSDAVYRLSTTLANMNLDQMQELIEHAMHLYDMVGGNENNPSGNSAADDVVDDLKNESSDQEDDEDGLPEAISAASSFVKKVISSLGNIDSEND
ncbi:MAG TPA: hypothetical protein PL188_02415 [Candidatus Cloacimonadota bacterium]|nr:hypothetical protein [Candidatus Cloacimonadota bacterium]